MRSCDNLTRKVFTNNRAFIFKQRRSNSRDPSRSGARAHRNQVLWPCKTRKCFVCLFFSVPANGLKWCTSRSALICVGNPDQIARRHIGNLTNSGHSALKAHVCCGPHYDNIIHKCQYSLYGYLPTFHIGHVSAVGLAPTIFTKYISCLEVNWCFQTRNIVYMSSYMWICG